MSALIRTLRAILITIWVLLGACTGTSLPPATPSVSMPTPATTATNLRTATSAPTVVATTAAPTGTAGVTAVAVACGSVTGYASDGAQMLLTLSAGTTATQYHLQYQFASVRPPADIGDRLASKTDQLVQVYGRQVPPDSGSLNAVGLRDFTATRVTTCSPTLSVAPAAFTGFVLPPGCAYVRPPALAFDQSDRLVDCGAAANRDARGTLAPAFTQQGWTSCVGLATATWAKGATAISISEATGAAGDLPRLTQRGRTTASCP